MYDRSIITGAGTQLSIRSGGRETTVDLYSSEGLQAVAALWVKLSAEFRLMYEPTWLGIPVIQVPCDIVAMQELIWRLRPDWIVECGVAHGGSAVLYASICELAGKGRVLGVDAEIRKFNRAAISAHPLAHRIELIEGGSTDEATFRRVQAAVSGASRVLVVLDSNHSAEHVFAELELYQSLVTAGSYVVVMDGAQADVWDIPRGKPEWRETHPLEAIERFLRAHPEFTEDPHYTRFHVTSCPHGFLRRRRIEEPHCMPQEAIQGAKEAIAR
jgi:cephalosporin hydroxylase